MEKFWRKAVKKRTFHKNPKNGCAPTFPGKFDPSLERYSKALQGKLKSQIGVFDFGEKLTNKSLDPGKWGFGSFGGFW